jgi:hypothetical protein
MLHYLKHISLVWNKILDGVPKSAVDHVTVEGLELHAPIVPKKDSREIDVIMETDHLFSLVSNLAVRQSLLRNLFTVPCLIPSMRVFLENLKYLEPYYNVLKGLIDYTSNSTICECFFKSYVAPLHLLVELHEGRLQPATSADDRMVAYMQLWIYAMRHFPQMVAVAPKKEPGQEKPVVLEPNPALWFKISEMVADTGFRTAKALKMKRQNPDESIARAFLLRARPSTKYRFLRITVDTAVKQITEILSMAKRIEAKTGTPQLTLSHRREPRDRRCGCPFENGQTYDQEFLFLLYLDQENISRSGEDISFFFVKRDFFHLFFDTGVAVSHISKSIFDTC